MPDWQALAKRTESVPRGIRISRPVSVEFGQIRNSLPYARSDIWVDCLNISLGCQMADYGLDASQLLLNNP